MYFLMHDLHDRAFEIGFLWGWAVGSAAVLLPFSCCGLEFFFFFGVVVVWSFFFFFLGVGCSVELP